MMMLVLMMIMKDDDIEASIILWTKLSMILMTAMNMKINSQRSKNDVNDNGDDVITHDGDDNNDGGKDPDGR